VGWQPFAIKTTLFKIGQLLPRKHNRRSCENIAEDGCALRIARGQAKAYPTKRSETGRCACFRLAQARSEARRIQIGCDFDALRRLVKQKSTRALLILGSDAHLKHTDILQVAVKLLIIKPEANHKPIWDLEAPVIQWHLHQAARRAIEQRTSCQ